MSVVLILILASLTMALLFLGAFIWAVRSGQFDDMHTPSVRVLLDEPDFGKKFGAARDAVAPSLAPRQDGHRDGAAADGAISFKP